MGALLGVMALGALFAAFHAARSSASASPADAAVADPSLANPADPSIAILAADPMKTACGAAAVNATNAALIATPAFLNFSVPDRNVRSKARLYAGRAPRLRRLAFTWTGSGADTKWNTTGNWSTPGGTGYPDDCNDDASIPYTAGGWDIALVEVQIDDLTISSSVDFTAAPNTTALLKADSIALSGSNDITLTFTDVTVKTFGCP